MPARARLALILVAVLGLATALAVVLVNPEHETARTIGTVPRDQAAARVRDALTTGPQAVDFGGDVALARVDCVREQGHWRCAAGFDNGVKLTCFVADRSPGRPHPRAFCPS